MDSELRVEFKRCFSQDPALSGKVPARINLLGTHIEHQGGFVNTLAVDHFLHFAAGYRNDSLICARNHDPSFPEVTFSLDEMVPDSPVTWEQYIRSPNIQPGHWGNYIRAACGYLSVLKGKELKQGLNLYFSGNIPVGAGLSSSSSLVVAVALMLIRAHQWDFTDEEVVEAAGRAEWYVGTRGGWGDHAAMIVGQKNRLAHFCFFPFQLEYFPFPSHLSVVCAHSMVKAKKSGEAKEIFNQRIAGYRIGLKLVHKYFPELREKCPYLRDINPRNLPEEKVYEILHRLPTSISVSSIYKELPEHKNFLDELFTTHSPADAYPVRNVMSYGIAECERSRTGAVLMKKSKYPEFGQLMFISHDGDRVSRWQGNQQSRWCWEATDQNVSSSRGINNSLGDEISSIATLPGAYHCSLPELDFIVDTVQSVKGVLGAKLTGAGLGGAVLVLVQKEQENEVISLLQEKYYNPRNLPPRLFKCRSVDGASLHETS